MLVFHISMAYISFILLIVRGVMGIASVNWRQYKLLRIAPHAIDTALLLSGIGTFITFGYDFMEEKWLWAKLLCVVGYVVFSVLAFRKKTDFSLPFYTLALCCFIAVMGLASVKPF